MNYHIELLSIIGRIHEKKTTIAKIVKINISLFENLVLHFIIYILDFILYILINFLI